MRVLVIGGVLALLLSGCAGYTSEQFADDMAGLRAGTMQGRSGWEQPVYYGVPAPRNCYTTVLMNGNAVTNCY